MRLWFPFLIGCAAIALFQSVVLVTEWFPHATWQHGGFEYFRTTVWDESWYFRIADRGYERDVPSYRSFSSLAFSPGYPMLLRLAHLVTGLPIATARVPLAAVLFLVSCVLLWRILESWSVDVRRNRWILALFAFSPGSFYFLTGYSEALYLPLLLLFFVLLPMRRFLAASLVVAAALFTRSPAIILAATLCVAVLVDNLRSKSIGLAIGHTARSLALLMPICALGLVGYLWITYAETGDPLAFLKSYTAWFPVEQSRLQTLALATPVRAVYYGFTEGIPSIVTSGFFLALVPPLVFAHRLAMPLSFVVFAAVGWLFFIWQNPPVHEPLNLLRWLAPVFPFHVALVLTTERLGRFRLVANIVLLAAFVGLYAVNVYRFVHHQWVS